MVGLFVAYCVGSHIRQDQVGHIPGAENPADILTKPLPWFSLKIFVKPLLLWKGDTVDTPLGTSLPEGSDVGPGLTVLGEQLSDGRDSANVSGHTIPAVLCGNQCAVLFDTEPTEDEILHGAWLVITFNLLGLFRAFVFSDFHSDY